MKNVLIILSVLTIFSCSKEPIATDAELLGTWSLASVSGNCSILPISGTADDQGCIANPTLEVNCSLIEFIGNGQLSYSYSLVKGTGSYTIEDNGITICTDRCLFYTFENSVLQLQTGTIPDCDPVYTFRKGSSSLDEIIQQATLKKIKRVTRNGLTSRIYNYAANGSLQQAQFFNNGDLSSTYLYAYTPLSTTITITRLSSGSVGILNSFYEAPDRFRIDELNSQNQLQSYDLYFYDQSYDCSYSRRETYENEVLTSLRNVSFTGGNCDSQYTEFDNGQLDNTTTIRRDNQKRWSFSLRDPLLPVRPLGNITEYIKINANEQLSFNSYTATYTYDAEGYPTTSTRTYGDGDVVIYTYEYE